MANFPHRTLKSVSRNLHSIGSFFLKTNKEGDLSRRFKKNNKKNYVCSQCFSPTHVFKAFCLRWFLLTFWNMHPFHCFGDTRWFFVPVCEHLEFCCNVGILTWAVNRTDLHLAPALSSHLKICSFWYFCVGFNDHRSLSSMFASWTILVLTHYKKLFLHFQNCRNQLAEKQWG